MYKYIVPYEKFNQAMAIISQLGLSMVFSNERPGGGLRIDFGRQLSDFELQSLSQFGTLEYVKDKPA